MNNNIDIMQKNAILAYTIALTILILTVLLIAIYFISKNIKKLHQSPAWLEMHKNTPTSKRNIKNISRTTKLNENENSMLADICSKNPTPNIEYAVRKPEVIDKFFAALYKELCSSFAEDAEEKKATLFSLRYKLESILRNSNTISSTKKLVAGQEITYTDLRGTMWPLILSEVNSNGMYLALPSAFASSRLKPEQYSKINLQFNHNSGMAYSFQTKVVSYKLAENGLTAMFVTNSNNLRKLQRRSAKRMVVNKPCTFSAVDADTAAKTYSVHEKKNEGTLMDVSAKGCQVVCGLPIKQGQYINVQFTLQNSFIDNATGLIVSTTKTEEGGKYILHIQFVDISIEVRNKIYACIYRYN